MTITELLNKIGADNIVFQNLDECLIRMQATKKGTHITFGTNAITPFGIATDTDKMGLVVWLDRKRVKEIMSAPQPFPQT